MSPGNVELVQVVVSMAVTLPSVVAIIVFDERRLRGVELDRAWPTVSRDAAIFGLWNLGVHPLCLFVHFIRTRRSFAGAGLAFLWLAAVVAVDAGAQWAVLQLIDWTGL